VTASEVRFLRYGADLGQTLNVSRDLRPDMVLLDAAMRDGPQAVRRLREIRAGLQVVAFAVSESVDTVLAWAEAGVAGYIPITAAMSDLHALVAAISAGRQTPLFTAGLLQQIAATAVATANRASGPHTLTPRELEIVGLISTRLSNKEIARQLNIGLAAAKSHVHNVLGKSTVQRRGQVAVSKSAFRCIPARRAADPPTVPPRAGDHRLQHRAPSRRRSARYRPSADRSSSNRLTPEPPGRTLRNPHQLGGEANGEIHPAARG
jgi:DNA-binding NarL/FixJ family response regulator